MERDTSLRLTGPQKLDLIKAIVDTIVSFQDLYDWFLELDIDLGAIASPNSLPSEYVKDAVEYMQQMGRIDQLIAVACHNRPQSRELRQVAEETGLQL